ncbi:hypothetical protein CI109_100342 [Kwoniella shandongensis]|uniref:Uncharacterized protein n=1 Tax=Kwoniella shandongensis TaxID=1734106 RepID=A0A5M6C7V0_9TREE|nr:uncharacterized protein CI109_001812 [Kwoniella shandongensis]KAA5529872.1 hypothetical protein CI109_001812 [Kwoniella shandongensis]
MSYHHTYAHTQTPYSPTLPNLIQSRALATSSIPFSQTTHTLIDVSSPPPPLPPPRGMGMCDVSPTTSSPSLYSRVGHSPRSHMIVRASRRFRVLSESDLSSEEEADDGEEVALEEEEEDPRRMSMVGGPKLRKYTETPWEEDWTLEPVPSGNIIYGRDAHHPPSSEMFSGFRHATRMISAATLTRSRTRDASTSSSINTVSDTFSPGGTMDTSSTRRGLAHILGVSGNNTTSGGPKHLLPSASGLSLASNNTTSTASSDERTDPITPKLRQGASDTSFTGLGSPTLIMATSKVRKSVTTTHRHDFSTTMVDQLTHSHSHFPPTTTPKAHTRVPVQPIHDNHTKLLLSKVIEQNLRSNTLALSPALGGNGFKASDRPLLSSGSPGFGLITLEVAQERERKRNAARLGVSAESSSIAPERQPQTEVVPLEIALQRLEMSSHSRPNTTYSTFPPASGSEGPVPTPLPSPPTTTNRIRTKKSGLMKLFNKASGGAYPPVPPQSSTTVVHQNTSATPGGKKGRPSTRQSGKSFNNRTKDVHTPTQSASVQDDLVTETTSHISSVLKPQLELRPISMTFTRGLPIDYLTHSSPRSTTSKSRTGPGNGDVCGSTPLRHAPTSSSTSSSSIDGTDPAVRMRSTLYDLDAGTIPDLLPEGGHAATISTDVVEQILRNARKGWKLQLFELEAQLRELRDELDETRATKSANAGARRSAGGVTCTSCGCSCGNVSASSDGGDNDLLSTRRVIDRARVKTAGARGVFGSGSLYE